MKKIYHLSACSTCQRILKELKPGPEVILQDIKSETMSPSQVDEMKGLAGSYEALFSKRAVKYKSFGLKDKNLTEEEMRQWIIEEYTFLKRPVIIIDERIFVGNSKKVVEAASHYI